jgi:hypothetical protein
MKLLKLVEQCHDTMKLKVKVVGHVGERVRGEVAVKNTCLHFYKNSEGTHTILFFSNS